MRALWRAPRVTEVVVVGKERGSRHGQVRRSRSHLPATPPLLAAREQRPHGRAGSAVDTARISGQVTRAGDVGVAGVEVSVFRDSGSGQFDLLTWTQTDATGEYVVGDCPPGPTGCVSTPTRTSWRPSTSTTRPRWRRRPASPSRPADRFPTWTSCWVPLLTSRATSRATASPSGSSRWRRTPTPTATGRGTGSAVRDRRRRGLRRRRPGARLVPPALRRPAQELGQ